MIMLATTTTCNHLHGGGGHLLTSRGAFPFFSWSTFFVLLLQPRGSPWRVVSGLQLDATMKKLNTHTLWAAGNRKKTPTPPLNQERVYRYGSSSYPGTSEVAYTNIGYGWCAVEVVNSKDEIQNADEDTSGSDKPTSAGGPKPLMHATYIKDTTDPNAGIELCSATPNCPGYNRSWNKEGVEGEEGNNAKYNFLIHQLTVDTESLPNTVFAPDVGNLEQFCRPFLSNFADEGLTGQEIGEKYCVEQNYWENFPCMAKTKGFLDPSGEELSSNHTSNGGGSGGSLGSDHEDDPPGSDLIGGSPQPQPVPPAANNGQPGSTSSGGSTSEIADLQKNNEEAGPYPREQDKQAPPLGINGTMITTPTPYLTLAPRDPPWIKDSCSCSEEEAEAFLQAQTDEDVARRTTLVLAGDVDHDVRASTSSIGHDLRGRHGVLADVEDSRSAAGVPADVGITKKHGCAACLQQLLLTRNSEVEEDPAEANTAGDQRSGVLSSSQSEAEKVLQPGRVLMV
ncbi:unnamed protein product [Amoebophrya sp. A120]|nr:unnamed protein product [Amoebophrya sp. A120]|eukprot:GSA120T00009969001.1